jgi:hypothetical protein
MFIQLMIFNLKTKEFEIYFKSKDFTRLACRGNFDNKRLCSRSRNFGIFSNGMFPHFLISQRLKYVANEHTNARLNKKKIIRLISK